MEVLGGMNNAEIMQRNLDDFREIQMFMLSAKKENAKETYSLLKRKYLFLKAALNNLGVSLTNIDEVNE